MVVLANIARRAFIPVHLPPNSHKFYRRFLLQPRPQKTCRHVPRIHHKFFLDRHRFLQRADRVPTSVPNNERCRRNTDLSAHEAPEQPWEYNGSKTSATEVTNGCGRHS